MTGNKNLNESYTIRFVLIAAVFSTTLITSNIIAVKIFEFGPFPLDAAVLLFPITYIIGDILTEVYGYSRARQIIWIGFFCNLIAVIAISIAGAIPAAEDVWLNQESWNNILGLTPRIVAASLIAYLAGEFVNSYVLAKMKIITEGRMLWARTITSTIFGQGLDTCIFIPLAFWGIFPTKVLALMILGQWLVKTAIEITATPITYIVVGWLKHSEGVDVYDYETNFSPIRFRK